VRRSADTMACFKFILFMNEMAAMCYITRRCASSEGRLQTGGPRAKAGAWRSHGSAHQLGELLLPLHTVNNLCTG
jgi:hypothetical protein